MPVSTITLRAYMGAADHEGMVAAQRRLVDAEGEGEYFTVEALAAQYSHLQRCDPDRDIIIAEKADGTIAGYARTLWDDLVEGFREHFIVCFADPAVPGADEQLLDWGITRALGVAATFPDVADRRLGAEAIDGTPRQALLLAHGFTPRTYWAAMVRPDLDNIPDRPLPQGVETRPVEPDHLRAMWECDIEAFRDHPGYVEQTETDWEKFRDEAAIDTSLWQVAWRGDEVVGQVRTRWSADEAAATGRRRGWTEDISTARAWRKRGVASALICSSLRQLAELGFDEAALGVDTDNPSGAFSLYQSLGYEITKRGSTYARKI